MRIPYVIVPSIALALVGRAHAGDFNGDGYSDLAIGAPTAVIGGDTAGAVHIMYGTAASGVATTNRQLLTQADGGTSEEYAQFGSAVAIGDFDEDGFDDLAVSAPFKSVGSTAETGVVYEYAGSAGGLTFRRLWHQNKQNIADKCEPDDRFGHSLAAADFDGDGRSDLAIGVLEKIGGKARAGAVAVLYGSGDGLDDSGDQLWHQNSSGVKDKVEADDEFGSSLATGDLDGDGRADLAIGIRGEHRKHGSFVGEGAVAVLFGSNGGLDADGDAIFDAWNLDGAETEADRGFGMSLAIGNFDGTGARELAIGAPFAPVGTAEDAGAVFVLGFTDGKPDFAGAATFTQQTGAIPGGAEDGDGFGFALDAGDFDADGISDLAIGAPEDAPTDMITSGSVTLVYGSASGLTDAGSERFGQGTAGINGAPENDEGFGFALAVGDFDGNGARDVAVGVPFESVGGLQWAGAVAVLYGTAAVGITATANQLWYEDLLPSEASAEFELFGLAVGS